MSEPSPNPETPPTPAATPTAPPATETPVPSAETPAPAAPAKPQSPSRGKKPFRGDRPKQDRPKLDFTELTTNVRLNELDKDIESELADAMAGFETEIQHESEAAKKQAMEAAHDAEGRWWPQEGADHQHPRC